MSELSKKDLHTPLNTTAISKLIGHVEKAWNEQAVAATLAASPLVRGAPATHVGTMRDLFFVSASAAAAGESMTIDVLKNGVSVLTAPFVFDTEAADTQIKLPLVAGTSVARGDVLTTSRTYVAGGGPTMAHNSVVAEWAP